MKLCALHDIEEPLQASHIIPKLFYRHLKRDAGNHPFYNIGSKQLQDGYKIPLLCHDAEEQFSKYEDYFARYIFSLKSATIIKYTIKGRFMSR